MKKVEKILIGQDKTYLSEAITKLPSNCIFDKGKVGCGIYDYLINEREFIDGKKEKELN